MLQEGEYAMWLYALLPLLIMSSIAEPSRVGFLQLNFGVPVARKIRCLENSLIALPFCLVLGVM
jgi:hypothetical protein